jgi:type III secretion protein J
MTQQMNYQIRSWTKGFLSFSSFFLLIAIIALAFTGCESKKTIVNGLDEREANEILVLLASKNIEAFKLQQHESGGGGGGTKIVLWDIAVNASDATAAMEILSSYGLPRRRGQNLLELFSAGGLVPSDLQQKIRYQAGLADQIAGTIRKIDGIIDADIQLSIPEEDPLNPNAPKGAVTASVYVKHTGVLDDPNSHLIPKIKRLVSSSVTGLSFDNVTVIPDRARFADSRASKEKPTELDYVKVWTVVVAKESLTRFQIIFFSLCLMILLLAFSACWLIWKLIPVLKQQGGIKELFHLTPLTVTPKEAKEKPDAAEVAKAADAKKDEKKKASDEPKVQENVEEP